MRLVMLSLVLAAVRPAPSVSVPLDDGPTIGVTAPRCISAIALRDDVPADQQEITRVFTTPLLAHYRHRTYITATSQDDGHGQVVAALEKANSEGCAVDLFFLVNGRDYVSWVEAMPPDVRPALDLVYDTGGGSADYASRWLAAGASTFVGHGGPNLAPVFYAFFLPRLVGGEDVDDAVTEANAATHVVIRTTAPLLVLAGEDPAQLWRDTEAHLFR